MSIQGGTETSETAQVSAPEQESDVNTLPINLNGRKDDFCFNGQFHYLELRGTGFNDDSASFDIGLVYNWERFNVGITYVTSFLVCGLHGCMLALEPEPVLPDLGVFEEGDVVVTFEGSVESWFFFLGVRPDNVDNARPFSHTEMVFRSSQGKLMLGGIVNEACRIAGLELPFETVDWTPNELSRRGELKNLDAIAKTRLLETICDKYRETYFSLPVTPVRILVFSAKEPLSKRLLEQSRTRHQATGYYDHDKQMLVVAGEMSDPRFWTVLNHEISHAVLYGGLPARANLPFWLSEGVATLFEGGD